MNTIKIKLTSFLDLNNLFELVKEYQNEGRSVMVGNKIVKDNITKPHFGNFILNLINENRERLSKDQYEDYYIWALELIKSE